MLPSREMAEIAVKALDGKKGKAIKLIRIDKITTLAEYFVICTGTSNTQINALCDEVEKQLTEAGEEPLQERALGEHCLREVRRVFQPVGGRLCGPLHDRAL